MVFKKTGDPIKTPPEDQKLIDLKKLNQLPAKDKEPELEKPDKSDD